jgi:uncharacterized protein DUF2637
VKRRARHHTPQVNTPPAATDATITGDRLIRRSTIAVVVLVALGAGCVSYGHAYELVHTHGESGAAAVIGPATVDGLMYASGMVLLQAARYRVKPPRLAWFGLWLGIAATVGANVAHGVGHGYIGALVSAWPAAALIFSYELLMRLIRTGAAKGAPLVQGHTAATGDQCPHRVAETAEDAVRARFLHARDCLETELSQRQLAAAFGIDRKRVADLVPETRKLRPLEPPAVQPAAHTGNGRAPVAAAGPESG